MKIITNKGVFDTAKELVVIQFDTNPEKAQHAKNIDNMLHDAMNYCIFPDGQKYTLDELKEFTTQWDKIEKLKSREAVVIINGMGYGGTFDWDNNRVLIRFNKNKFPKTVIYRYLSNWFNSEEKKHLKVEVNITHKMITGAFIEEIRIKSGEVTIGYDILNDI